MSYICLIKFIFIFVSTLSFQFVFFFCPFLIRAFAFLSHALFGNLTHVKILFDFDFNTNFSSFFFLLFSSRKHVCPYTHIQSFISFVSMWLVLCAFASNIFCFIPHIDEHVARHSITLNNIVVKSNEKEESFFLVISLPFITFSFQISFSFYSTLLFW